MGYLIIDDRASGEGYIEKDTLSCKHCQAIVYVAKGSRKSSEHWCFRCAAVICEYCAWQMNMTGICLPFMKQIEMFDSPKKWQKFFEELS